MALFIVTVGFRVISILMEVLILRDLQLRIHIQEFNFIYANEKLIKVVKVLDLFSK